jgi:hypothetical protein
MYMNIPKAELEAALNRLEVSEESKKTFASSLTSRNEPLLFGHLAVGLGSLFIFSNLVMMYHFLSSNTEDIHRTLTFPFLIGILFLVYGKSKIRAIKLQRSCVELIMKTKTANHGLESTGAPPAAGTPETHP